MKGCWLPALMVPGSLLAAITTGRLRMRWVSYHSHFTDIAHHSQSLRTRG